MRVRGLSHQKLIAITSIWGFLKIRGTLLGLPMIRTIIYWGLYWGRPI